MSWVCREIDSSKIHPRSPFFLHTGTCCSTLCTFPYGMVTTVLSLSPNEEVCIQLYLPFVGWFLVNIRVFLVILNTTLPNPLTSSGLVKA